MRDSFWNESKSDGPGFREYQARRAGPAGLIPSPIPTSSCALQDIPKAASIWTRIRQRRSLIIQTEYGTLQARQIANVRCPCSREKGEVMKKTLLALCAAATLAVSAVAVPAPAQAQRGVAAGVAAGLIGGAIVGGAIASQNGYYGPGYGYYAPGPAYVAEPGYGPDCFWQRQRFWDGYTWRVRRVRVCD